MSGQFKSEFLRCYNLTHVQCIVDEFKSQKLTEQVSSALLQLRVRGRGVSKDRMRLK